MHKLMLSASITAALFAGSAHAVIIESGGKPIVNPADTYQVFLSGASAPKSFIENLVTNTTTVPVANRICSGKVYKFQDDGSGSNQNAYFCAGNATNPALAPLLAGAKKNILLYKRSSGGSILGVNPLVNDPLVNSNIAYLRVSASPAANVFGAPSVSAVTSCTVLTNSATFQSLKCTYTDGTSAAHPTSIWTKSDFGVSDVNPLMFSGPIFGPGNFPPAIPGGVSAPWTIPTQAGLNSLTIKNGPEQTFGIVANTFFFNQLKVTQAAVHPSLTKAQIANLLRGTYVPGAGLPALPAGKSLHVCARTNGSGTKAVTAMKFGTANANFNVAGVPLALKPDTGVAATAGTVLVHQMGSQGDLEECLAELSSGINGAAGGGVNPGKFNPAIWPGPQWAIGYASTDNNANGAKAYEFIRIGGVTPTLANVKNRTYKDWAELTFQYKTTHVFDAGELALVNEIIREAGNPAAIQAVDVAVANHTAPIAWGQSGFLASPTLWGPTTAAFINSLSHARGAPNPVSPVDDTRWPCAWGLVASAVNCSAY